MKTAAGYLAGLILAGLVLMTDQSRARTWSEENGALSFTAVGEVKITDPSDESSDGKVGMTHLSIWAPFGQVDVGNLQLAAGGGVGWTRFTFEDFPESGDEDLIGVGIPLMLSREPVNDWSGFLTLMPVWNSDLRSGHSLGAKLIFHTAADYQLNPTLRLRFGVAYDTAFGKNAWYPVGGVIWNITPEWEAHLVLPQPCVYWRPADRWGAFAFVMPAGDQWSVFDENDEEMVFQTETWRFGLGAEYRVAGPCWLRLAAGMDLERQYEFSRDNETVWKSDVEDTGFVSVSLVLY